jgi:protein involved in temperature-dependent protein secretion
VHLLQSRIDQAIALLETARRANPALHYVHAWLASAYALKGDTQRATAALGHTRRLSDVYSSIARVTAHWVPKSRAMFEETFLAGLRKAGLPEE